MSNSKIYINLNILDAYHNPTNMYQVSKSLDLAYGGVFKNTKALEKMGLIQLVEISKNTKNVTRRQYKITHKGHILYQILTGEEVS